jgi:very-short-patch-repair endonuclease
VPRSNLLKETTRSLRKRTTPSEQLFWKAVRNRQLKGRKFLRQFAIPFEIDGQKRFFIADFYCAKQKLVIEIDGAIHETQKDYDTLRTEIIKKLGTNVIRFNNEEIELNITGVLEKIEKFL